MRGDDLVGAGQVAQQISLDTAREDRLLATVRGPVTSETAAPLPRRRPWVPIPCRGRSAPDALRGV
ncbi:hypothetical protein CP976_42425 [Streptomyces coeruleorubidus]|uniref:Uncharacterized protein n=1 Tax=Streptomyces coeruleorubidus TaxID=116188 RepID=A0A5J6IHG6_STRC4|nr:hypothetical protein CP976_42425 [Streptomyces coeruleorubidus]